MASISAPRLPSTTFKRRDSSPSRHFSRSVAASPRCPLSPLKRSEPGLCRCRNPRSGLTPPGEDSGWKSLDSFLQNIARSAVKRLDDCVNSFRRLSDRGGLQLGNAGEVEKGEGALVAVKEDEVEVWNWERWKRHFVEVEEQDWIASVLKMQLNDAVAREDYKDAAKLKLALNAARESDTVGSAIHDYEKAIAEERYKDAAFLRDHAGTGLLGWWAGISKDGTRTYGRIINISAEHGRYVARSYSSRQLAMSRPGSPLFEVYFTCDSEGYKQQAVYLRQNNEPVPSLSKKSAEESTSSLNEANGSSEGPSDISSEDVKTIEEVDGDSDLIDGLASIKNILQDVIPGVKVKVLKVVSPRKVDRDLISKVIEQIIEEDEESDEEIQGSEEENKSESDTEEIEMVAGDETSDTTAEQSEVSVKFVIGTLMEKMIADVPPKNLMRVPAELEMMGRLSFSFSVKKEDAQNEAEAGDCLQSKTVSHPLHKGSHHARSDLSKISVAKERKPIKVLVDIGELISLTMNQNQNLQALFGTTYFDRLEIPKTADPLSGFYIGAHGMYTSEVLNLKRRFGQWHEDDATKRPKDLEFYEYVEAYKLTGALAVPAGQVIFRAKVGKKNQLPHTGIIPEEFGVIARYKGQGRLADPEFQNPRWVDGELVILDGKHIRAGPVIGFVYWAPEYNFLVFFNRLRLPD